jgi:DnaD/phage-associated family protein
VEIVDTDRIEIISDKLYTVQAEAVAAVLDAKNADAALLLLALLRQKNDAGAIPTPEGLGISEERFNEAARVLSKFCTVPSSDASQAVAEEIKPKPTAALKSSPRYTRTELAGAMDNNDFAYIYNLAERAVGRPLLEYEVSSLFMLYDYFRLPANVTALLINKIVRDERNKPGRDDESSVSFREIKNEALKWVDRGVATVEDAERYIAESDLRDSAAGKIIRTFGIGGRAVSPTERKYIDSLIDLDPELQLVPLAYDITVTKKGSLVWPYLRKIVESWRGKGYHTPADVESGERIRGASGASKDYGGANQPDPEYVARVKEFLRQEERGDGA